MSENTSSTGSYFMVDVAKDDRRSTAAFLRGKGDGRQRAYDRYMSAVVAAGGQMDLPHHRHFSQVMQAKTLRRVTLGQVHSIMSRMFVPAVGLVLGVAAYIRYFWS